MIGSFVLVHQVLVIHFINYTRPSETGPVLSWWSDCLLNKTDCYRGSTLYTRNVELVPSISRRWLLITEYTPFTLPDLKLWKVTNRNRARKEMRMHEIWHIHRISDITDISMPWMINSSPWTKWLPFRKRYFQMHFRECLPNVWNTLTIFQ